MAPPEPLRQKPIVTTHSATPLPDGGIIENFSPDLNRAFDSFQSPLTLLNREVQCGGTVLSSLTAKSIKTKYTLFPSTLNSAFSFHPFVTPQEFGQAYNPVRTKILEFHQRLVDPNFLQTHSIDAILEDLNILDQGLDAIESIISNIRAAPPQESFVTLMEGYSTDWEKFMNSLLSAEPFSRLIEGLQQKLQTGYNGKHNKALVEVTLEKWIHRIRFKVGAGLAPDKKAELEKVHGELIKAEFEYANAFALTATTWIYFDPAALIGFKQEYNGRVVTWMSRLFINDERGLETFLIAYNTSKNHKGTAVTKENLAVSLDRNLIQYLKDQYFPKHPKEFIRDEDRFLQEYRAYVQFYLDSAKETSIDLKKIKIREFYNTYLIQHPDRKNRLQKPLEEIVHHVEQRLQLPSSSDKYPAYFSEIETIVRETKKRSFFSLDFKIPVVRSSKDGTQEFSDFADNTPSEPAMVYAYGVYWKTLDNLITPKAINILRIRGKIAKALGFSSYAELKSLEGQNLYANPEKEIAHWMRVGTIVRKITQDHWQQVLALQKRIKPNGLPPSYETSQPYHDILRREITETKRVMAQLEFGPPEEAVRKITMPNISKIYGQPYPEITGSLRAKYPLYYPDVLIFGNDCSVYTWDLFDHPGKKSSASVAGSVNFFREMGKNRNYYANILLTLPARSLNPQIKLDDLMTMIHEPAHPAYLLTPVEGQNDFYNLAEPVELLNDFLTRFSEREYLTKGVPGGVNFWDFGTVPARDKRRPLNKGEVEIFKKAAKLNILEGFERLIPRGIFNYELHIHTPKSPREMAKRFIEIAAKTYNEPFMNQDTAFAKAAWSGGFGQSNYGPAAVTAYLNPDLFYPYFSSLFDDVGGGLDPANFHLLQRMFSRISAMKPPKQGGEGWIENLEKSVNQMLSEIHLKYGDRVKKIPNKFDIEDVYKRFEDYYKKAV